jgi:hypothetical protein
MKPTKSLFILAFILAPAIASAQGYYGGGYNGGGGGYYSNPYNTRTAGGFWNRQGRLIWGFSLGLGGMKENGQDVTCNNCDYSPVSGMISGHIGGFVSPRLALMGELQGNMQTLSTNGVDNSEALVMSALMFSAQYWLTPQLWIKGGIGVANLRVDDNYGTVAEVPENGLALMAGIGYELWSSQRFSVDLQGRVISGQFNSVDDHVTGGTIGVGLNWF